MRKLLVLVIFSVFYSFNALSQNLDSLLIEDVKNLDSKIEKKLNTVIYSLSEESRQQNKAYDSLYHLHQEAVKKLSKLDQRVVVENDKTRNTLTDKTNNLNKVIQERNRKDKIAFVVHYILFGFLFILIFYLMVILRISRRESIEYLLSQTDGLREQNYEILERAEELKKIKKTLKGLIKEQKQEDKTRKKARKKAEKKNRK